MDYKDQIKSPKWQKKRLEILKRDEFTCQQCGNKELTLHVHHKHYNKGAMIWQYLDWELTTLCEDCHSKGHERKNYEMPIFDFDFSIFDEIELKSLKEFLLLIKEDYDGDYFIVKLNEYLQSQHFGLIDSIISTHDRIRYLEAMEAHLGKRIMDIENKISNIYNSDITQNKSKL